MKATKYIYTREVTIPDEDKYNLGEIVLHITDICYIVYNLYYSRNYKKVGNDLINNTVFNYDSVTKRIEIKIPIKNDLYFFCLHFSFDIKNENEVNNIKEEYKDRIIKWMYDNSEYNNVIQEETEIL